MFSSFRRRGEVEDSCRQKWESRFIKEGSSATTIFDVRLNKEREAALVINEKEGPDQFIVFTYKDNNDKGQEFGKGDFFFWKDKLFFTFEDIDIVHDVNYKKQWAYECNAAIRFADSGEAIVDNQTMLVADDFGQSVGTTPDNSSLLQKPQHSLYINNYGDYSYLNFERNELRDGLLADSSRDNIYFGRFISSLSKYIDQEFSKNLLLTKKEKPILIIPSYPWLVVGTRFLVKNKPYRIIEIDDITNPNISYCSLEFDFIDKQGNIEEAVDETALLAGVVTTLSTRNGVFETSKSVEIISITENEVKFKVPFGIDKVMIKTFDEEREYNVR